MKVLYYDCFAGISGDMNLGAMLDLGVDREHLLTELARLDMGPYEVKISGDRRRGITGTKVDVIVGHGGHENGHGARTFRDIAAMIRESGLSDPVKVISLRIFTRIAEAEAKVHGHAVEDVHFHEVGAIDSIVDIVGAAICLDCLKVDRILSSPVQVGGGFVQCAHGLLPVPAPATVEILRGIPMKTGLVPFETTTPTGAAILAAVVDVFTETLQLTPEKVGYGIGHRDTEVPNVLRVLLGQASADDVALPGPGSPEALILECNIDDMNPEHYERLMELFFEAGAHDVYLTPIMMKKSRPAVTLSVLCDADRRQAMEEIFWRHSSTFGLRTHKVSKTVLQREMQRVATAYGEVSVKNGYLNGRLIKSKPEYEDCKRLAKEKGLSMAEIYESVRSRERVKT